MRLTHRTEQGGVNVDNLPAALDKLAAYEDLVEQAENIMPLPEIRRVLSGGSWMEYWAPWTPGRVWGELQIALDATLKMLDAIAKL